MIPSMSRPANPSDNASCESFIKTRKREEIYAHKYENLEHLRTNIEEFIQHTQLAALRRDQERFLLAVCAGQTWKQATTS
jgi:transposase InsO family protein